MPIRDEPNPEMFEHPANKAARERAERLAELEVIERDIEYRGGDWTDLKRIIAILKDMNK